LLASEAVSHEAIRELLPDYAAGVLPEERCDAVRGHLAAGCTRCLDDVFSRPVGLPRAVPAPIVPVPVAVPTVERGFLDVLLRVSLALASVAAVTFFYSRAPNVTPDQDLHADTTRVVEPVAPVSAPGGRGAVPPAPANAAAPTAVAALPSRAVDDLPPLSPPAVRRAAQAGIDVTVHPAFGGARLALIGPRPLPSSRDTACSVFAGIPKRLCDAFCGAQACDQHPGPECDRLRTRFRKATGGSIFPCEMAAIVSGDIAPCDQSHVDLWAFSVMRDHEYTVTVDTADPESAADLCLFGFCEGGETFFGDDQIACTFPPGSARCPRTSFVASSDQTCSVGVAVCQPGCRNPEVARYRLALTPGQPLTLTADNAF